MVSVRTTFEEAQKRDMLTCEQEDEERDKGYFGRARRRDKETKAGCKESPRHIWECKEEKISSSEGIDRPHGWEGEEPVHKTKAPRRKQGLLSRVPGFNEDGRGVESDDIDAAHLLSNHDNEGGEGSAAHTWNGEELIEAREVSRAFEDDHLLLQLSMNVVKVSCSLKFAIAKTDKRLVCVSVSTLLHVPPR